MLEKILLAEDEPHIAKLVQFKLQKEGYEVLYAKDGKEAYEITKKEHPDLVLLDVMMPVLDGFQVLKMIKSDPELKDTLVAMLSAKSQRKEILDGLRAGVCEYITKPFVPAELVARIKEILARNKSRSCMRQEN